ncbi:MAG: hypothetical protein KC444_01125 [Nitrosopumilus sp.]|nr:hypothetical protein [Nitrosopumilus sp.]
MSEIKYLADKVIVHRWPHDTPLWDPLTQENIDKTINKNPEKKLVAVKENKISIQNIEFDSIQKIGISVPFFKDECTMIFEGRFGMLYGHAHITVKSGNYLDVFGRLIKWRSNFQSGV